MDPNFAKKRKRDPRPTPYRPLEDSWCISKCNIEKVRFEWNIQHFVFQNTDCDFESIQFSLKDSPDYWWNLKLVAGPTERPSDFSVAFSSRTYPNKMYRFTTAILNQSSEKISAQEVILQKNSQPSLIIFTVDKQLAVDSLLPDGSLTIHCEVEYAVGKENVSDTNEDCRGHQIECNNQFSARIGNLFNNVTFSDVTLKVGDQEFKAHKNILAARSEVFAAMLGHPTKKQSSNKVEIVEIKDIEPDVFEEVLRFIYTGLVPLDKMESMADLLLEAANEYSLEKLKISCENHEIHNMSADACFRHLTGTDHINPEERLKKSAILYFRRFPGKVMATDDWKEYKESPDDPVWTLIRDIMETIHLPQV